MLASSGLSMTVISNVIKPNAGPHPTASKGLFDAASSSSTNSAYSAFVWYTTFWNKKHVHKVWYLLIHREEEQEGQWRPAVRVAIQDRLAVKQLRFRCYASMVKDATSPWVGPLEDMKCVRWFCSDFLQRRGEDVARYIIKIHRCCSTKRCKSKAL